MIRTLHLAQTSPRRPAFQQRLEDSGRIHGFGCLDDSVVSVGCGGHRVIVWGTFTRLYREVSVWDRYNQIRVRVRVRTVLVGIII